VIFTFSFSLRISVLIAIRFCCGIRQIHVKYNAFRQKKHRHLEKNPNEHDLGLYESPMSSSNEQMIAPQGKICSIVETKTPVDMGGILRQKSVTFVWEVMFTRSLFKTYDMIEQHHLLNTVANLIDNKRIKTTTTDLFTPINAENLRKAHKKLESGNTIGKIVLSGF
jgi:hypothetical protein